ncbi:MAG: FdtA/QdtA family cupin domain-containing protein [Bacteroidia bacterium]|nr:FdtA/QdtA family cupin domain-containing protein [Bacteroidia bacterium]NND09692.1 WxcM-like domain-containing protein [Flavobacteriaceae bacterium]MBT8311146.1 FdtA/QdtA family cupin domain-containing protein [Bacteroidia bacterium]NNK28170.1 WxcM-like domain-containing protein [Flavobacteriaceae bacterium]NNL60970.1 WxcM-like domain-containing protein [Flavobacteriaceae bacterium]
METSTVNDIKILDIPKIKDVRGSLAVIENDAIPFAIKRVYYLFDVPSDSYRGGHAHKDLHQLLIAISGSFSVILKDSLGNEKTVTLKKPDVGLLIPNMIWREIEDFSSGAICLVIASDVYKEEDYIWDLEQFRS